MGWVLFSPIGKDCFGPGVFGKGHGTSEGEGGGGSEKKFRMMGLVICCNVLCLRGVKILTVKTY